MSQKKRLALTEVSASLGKGCGYRSTSINSANLPLTWPRFRVSVPRPSAHFTLSIPETRPWSSTKIASTPVTDTFD